MFVHIQGTFCYNQSNHDQRDLKLATLQSSFVLFFLIIGLDFAVTFVKSIAISTDS